MWYCTERVVYSVQNRVLVQLLNVCLVEYICFRSYIAEPYSSIYTCSLRHCVSQTAIFKFLASLPEIQWEIVP